MIIYTPPSPPTRIPVVDLTDSFSSDFNSRKKIAWEIHKACRETGFFYISNHGVDQTLIDAQFEWTRLFFELPLEQKLAIHMKNSPSTGGYEPVGGQVLDSQDPNTQSAPPDLKESFYCLMELPDDHPWSLKRIRGFGHNQWPSTLPGFREQMLKYQAAMRSLGDHVLSLLALSLDLDEDHFKPYFDMPLTTLRLLRYPPHPKSAQANQLGAGAHTDWGGITLLAQDNLGGLEVRNVEDKWIPATPMLGTFVINLGDLMQRWTNNLYRSNMHRVRNNNSSRDRYSVPYFYSPRPNLLIDCLPNCSDTQHPPLFPTCTAAEHINEMFQRSYGYAPAKS